MKLSSGEKFWIGLAGYVAVADMILWRKRLDTMSATFSGWCATPKGKAACVAGLGVIASHLFFKTPLIPGEDKLRIFVQGADFPWATHVPYVAEVTFTDPVEGATLSVVTSKTEDPSSIQL